MRRKPSCTINTSCLIALDHLGLIPTLASLFQVVLLPKAVRIELYRRRATKDRIKKVIDDFAFFQKCDSYDLASVDIVLVERRGKRDRGEAECVIQAAENGAFVLIDDAWGRELAERYGLETRGTLGVLDKLRELELIGSRELRSGLEALRKRGIRLPSSAVKAVLRKWGEAELPA